MDVVTANVLERVRSLCEPPRSNLSLSGRFYHDVEYLMRWSADGHGRVPFVAPPLADALELLERRTTGCSRCGSLKYLASDPLCDRCLDKALDNVVAFGYRGKPTYIYVIRNESACLSKIGITDEPSARLRALENACGVELEIVHLSVARSRRAATDVEAESHRRLRAFRAQGEWFRVSSSTAVGVVRSVTGDVVAA